VTVDVWTVLYFIPALVPPWLTAMWVRDRREERRQERVMERWRATKSPEHLAKVERLMRGERP